MNTCPAVKATGDVCGKRCTRGEPRCGTHMAIVRNYGPHTTARKELQYSQKALYDKTRSNGLEEAQREQDEEIQERMFQDLNHALRLLKINQDRDLALLVRRQEDEVRLAGDPDAEARLRRAERDRERLQRQRLLFQQRNQLMLNNHQNMNFVGVAVEANHVPRGELENFAHDNQNVHTRIAVHKTKEMVQKIIDISVPTDYRWNVTECSKTPGDIISSCKLTPRSAWQMTSKYCQDEDVYELGKGIYGKVLDGVWQYIATSPDKDDLCKILKQEMEDNIGMCAQGNLTRLCNILSGYMEGIGVQESPAEVLGRKLPLLMEIENIQDRLNEAYKVLVELRIPEEQWLSWVQPLVDEETVTLSSDVNGRVSGIVIN